MRVLIVRLDAIGDYVLWRSCFRALRTSLCFRDAHITLLGNRAWKQLFEAVDASCADEAIWVNPSDYVKTSIDNLLPFFWQFRPSFRRRRQQLRDVLAGKKYDLILLPTTSRNPWVDHLFASLSSELWGVSSPGKLPTDSAFTRLAPAPSPAAFIFQQNCAVLDFFIGEESRVGFDPLISLAEVSDSRRVAIFPGGSHWTKRWPVESFVEVARYLIDVCGREVVVIGGPDDRRRAAVLVEKTSRPGKIQSKAGGGTLLDMAATISRCALVVSNDTCAAHFGAAQRIPTVCITNGIGGKNTFWPYPAAMNCPVFLVTAGVCKTTTKNLIASQVVCYRNLLRIAPADVISAAEKLLVKPQNRLQT